MILHVVLIHGKIIYGRIIGIQIYLITVVRMWFMLCDRMYIAHMCVHIYITYIRAYVYIYIHKKAVHVSLNVLLIIFQAVHSV